MNAQRHHEFQKQLFDDIEFRLEIFSTSDSKYAPITQEIRKDESGLTTYRPLRLLNVENPALVEGFKSLKVSTRLPDDTIILELALSQRANHEDFSSYLEQPIGSYLIGNGETVELPELTKFGFAPMIAKAVRLITEDVPLDRIPQKNHTTGLQIMGIRKKANLHLITIKNISDKTICSYSIGLDYSHGGSTHTTHSELPAGAEDCCLFCFQPHAILAPLPKRLPSLEPEILVIKALKYEDNSCEGISPLIYPQHPAI